MKILLLHGWDWKKYPKFKPKNQWENRQIFLDLLGKDHELLIPSMPGFSDDTPVKIFNLKDYSEWLNKYYLLHKPDIIIGYSFGSAVAVSWLNQYKINVPLILISPAICRNYVVKISKLSLILKKILVFLKLDILVEILNHINLKLILKNQFYSQGNWFLRRTYLNIVKIDLSSVVTQLLNNNFRINFIFGELDTATPFNIFSEKVSSDSKSVKIIKGAGHNVAGTHPGELVRELNQIFLDNTPKNTF